MCVAPLNVLVIEDDALIALLLEDLLAGMGHVVCATAATQAEAISAAHCHRPDLMIADVRLRSGNGVSAVTEILRAGPVPHVFLSGDPADVVARCPDAIVVAKPFRPSLFAKAVDRALKAAASS
jgi:CheY-like chemotaxis protein